MRRVAIMLVVLIVVSAFEGSASAGEKGIRRYLAQTSDGQSLRFRTVRDDPTRRLDAMFFGERGPEPMFQLACDDGTTKEIGGAGFSQWPWFLDQDGHVLVNEDFSSGRHMWGLHIEGSFRPADASGTIRYTEVSLSADETPRLCSTDDVTWTAERV
jgi:hypothetical protein